MKDSLIKIVEKLLAKNNILFDKQELAFQIQSHPSYPSLHAITGVLDHFNIDNIAADVPKNVETLLQLPNCFIAQIETEQGKELVTVFRKKLDYIIFYPSNKKEKISESDFLEKFTGIIVAVEKPEVENKQSFQDANIVMLAILSLLTVGVLLTSGITILQSGFFLTSLLGVFISVSIYKQELGMSSVIGNAFCSSTNEKKDCDAVLSSKGATIFKNFKLSDFSLVYFSSLTLITFLAVLSNVSLGILSILSLTTIPVTIYSIYYQFKIVKKWCFLCLSIVGVLWIQSSFTIIDINSNLIFSFDSLLITVFSFLAVSFIWNSIKPKLKEFQENKKEKLEFHKFKRNYTLFSSLLNSSRTINTQLKHTSEIVFGNQNSPLEIVIITNPFCGHCKPIHKMIDNMLHTYKEDVKVIVRFNISSANKENDVVKITTRLLEIFEKQGTKICLDAMSQIYEGESVANWLQKWGNCNEKEKYIAVLEKENVWCKDNAINFTPEILINGKSFPKEYDRADLVYFVEELHEDYYNVKIENSKLELSN